ncbi:MAG: LL-diaminopimelate aminotransferase [Clostridia bacterium]|nr:LL-diaminopimelate aminotransferase [Clostridia bacterium]
MVTTNQNYQNLKESYLFSEIAHRVNRYAEEHPDAKIIRLGIGDVTLPLCPAVIEAMHNAVDDMAAAETFHGYGPEQGYGFLRDAIRNYYAKKGLSLESNEIFVSDGAKSDVGNILDIFSKENTVLVTDPVYPVYVDTNTMDGRKILFADSDASNGFLPMPSLKQKADIIYLCSPNNPTGAAYNRIQLKEWVNFAKENHAVILYDAAYEAFISDSDLPTSIYEIEGAKSCAIEFCSLSKTAGFTGTRCGYTVVPQELLVGNIQLNKLWFRRQTTKFNGVSYVVQRGAEAVFSESGMKQIKENIDIYKKNAEIITDALDTLGIWYTGGKNSPYVWLKCPDGLDSWAFFDLLLQKANVVGTPGAGFGKNGEGFFRLTAFNNEKNTREAMKRIKELLKK